MRNRELGIRRPAQALAPAAPVDGDLIVAARISDVIDRASKLSCRNGAWRSDPGAAGAQPGRRVEWQEASAHADVHHLEELGQLGIDIGKHVDIEAKRDALAGGRQAVSLLIENLLRNPDRP